MNQATENPLGAEPSPELSPARAREIIARGEYSGNTSRLCPGYAQANLVILPGDWAREFSRFAAENPKPCPLLETLAPGDPFTRRIADGADVRDTIPRYRVWENGVLVDEPTDVISLWRDDLVSFFLGCSFTFDSVLAAAGLPVRHVEEGRNVSMYKTSRPCRPVDRLKGPLVVSMRPMPAAQVEKAAEVTARFGGAHGGPVFAGDPAELGIADISRPEFGDPVTINEGEVPVFWACGVTPQAVLMEARPPFAITHAPGHMFICDLRNEELGRVFTE